MNIYTKFSYAFVFTLLTFFFSACNDQANRDLTSVTPSKIYTAEQLITETTFQPNKETEKDVVIEVNGVVHEVNSINNRYTILLNGNKADESYIICDMNTNQTHTTKAIKSGDSILVKGLFKGVLKDVIMLNCVVINTK